MTVPTLSVVSAVYDKARHLPALLANLRDQADFGGGVEFVFADDASTDESCAVLAAAAVEDPRIRLIRNVRNFGPAIRFNQAAAAARGEWLLPVDADDLLSGNAASVFLSVARRHGADLVFARSRRGAIPRDLPLDPKVTVTDDPLLFAAKRRIVRMGYLVRAATWHEAGGADERIFIQDQSLPLRLGAAARRAAHMDHVAYWLSPRDGNSLSTNIAQQHHDRFLAMAGMLDHDLSDAARRAIERQMISAWWKMQRQGGERRYETLYAYLGNRLFGRGLSSRERREATADFASRPGIRRNTDV